MSVYEADIRDLHVDSVTKSFGQNRVLTDIYLSCRPGEIIGLLGKNGSGKSTLMKIIFGAIPADTKFVRADGKIIHLLSDSSGLIRYLPQTGFLPDNIRVSLAIKLYCADGNGEIIASDEVISRHLNKKIGDVSAGEKRLLEVYLAIYSDSRYILVDEPFNGLAPIFKERVMELIKEQSKKKGFIITDQDYRAILGVSTRVVLLRDGGLINIKSSEELGYWGYTPW